MVVLISAGVGTLELCSATNTWTAVGTVTVPFSSLTTANNTTAAMGVGSGASLFPVNLGQVLSNTTWMQPGIPVPALSTSTTGGSIASGHTIHVVVTYNTALGETLPSIEATISTAGGGGTNSVTVTAPTLPIGYTGYTVYDFDGSIASYPNWLRQTSSAACVNITINCVIGTVAVGPAAPTVNSAWQQPPNNQAFNGHLGEIPTIYFPKPDGNYYPWVTVDWSTSNNYPAGTPMFTHRTFWSDMGNGFNTSPAYGAYQTAQGGNNALVSMNHLYGVGVSQSNQDRVLWLSGATPLNDTSAHYALEGLQVELDYNCSTCSINGSPDGELSAISAQLDTTNAASNWSTNGFQSNAIQGRLFRSGVGRDNAGMYAINGNVINTNSSWTPGSELFALLGRWGNGSSVSATNMTIGGLRIIGASSRLGSFNYGIFSTGTFTPSAGNDYFIDQRTHNWYSAINGVLGASGLDNSDGTTQAMPVNASLNVTGSVTTSQIASGWAMGYTGSCGGGASSYTYNLVAVDSNGGQSVSALSNNITGCTNPLTSGNPITLSVGGTVINNLVYRQAARIDVYRVSGPMATGKVGSITCNFDVPVLSCTSFIDTGLTATSALPTGNTSGGISAGGLLSPQAFTAGALSSGVNANVTPVTVNTNTASDQNLMTYTIPANGLNLVGRNIHIWAAAVYTTPAASVATINMKAKLCTVSGCGSGTVITPCTFTSSANPGTVTNNSANFTCDITTQTAGTAAAFEAHGNMIIDLGATPGLADTTFSDTNAATVGTIDSTGQLFLQITGAFSVASASNSMTQRQLLVTVTN